MRTMRYTMMVSVHRLCSALANNPVVTPWMKLIFANRIRRQNRYAIDASNKNKRTSSAGRQSISHSRPSSHRHELCSFAESDETQEKFSIIPVASKTSEQEMGFIHFNFYIDASFPHPLHYYESNKHREVGKILFHVYLGTAEFFEPWNALPAFRTVSSLCLCPVLQAFELRSIKNPDTFIFFLKGHCFWIRVMVFQ